MPEVPDALLREPVAIFLTIMAVILIAPLLSERVRLPGIVGIILAGMLIGPHALNLLESQGTIALLAEVGLVYLMFTAGLEVDIHQFSRVRGKALLFGLLTYAFPQVIGMLFGRLLGMDWMGALLLGSAFSSHTLIALPLLSRLGLLTNEAVAVTVGATVMTDITAFIVLAIVIGAQSGTVTVQYFILLGVLSAAYAAALLGLVPRLGKLIFRRLHGNAVEFQFVLVVLFLAGLLAERIGIHAVVGAFLAGLAINSTLPPHSPVIQRVLFLGEAFFIPLFLMYSGMITDPLAFVRDTQTILLAAGVTVVAYASKLIAAWLAGIIFKYSRDEMWTVYGLSHAQAAVTIPTLIIGVELGLFSEQLFNAAILMILLTSITSPLLVQRFGLRLRPTIVRGEQPQPFERILLAVDDPEEQEPLITLAAILARSDKGIVMPLHIAEEVNGRVVGLEKQEKVLHAGIFDDPDIPTMPIRRIDTSIAKGILRASKEHRASLIILGWDGTPTYRFNLLGSVHDHVALGADVPVLVGRLTMPVNALDSVRIVVPPDNFSAAAARQALRMVTAIAEEINVPFSILASPRHAAYLREEYEELELEYPCEIIEIHGDPVTFCKNMADKEDDLFVVATAGVAHRFRSSMGRFPESLAAATQSSIAVIRYT